MSLHVLANHMAARGRGSDSMLVHMTPHEVAGLQALAVKHGGSLTINPETGLPEAGFLSSILPMIAGFALGPAGFGLVESALGAGAIVGGVTGLASGSLSKGLMAGLGAYGGYGIGESLAGLGASKFAPDVLANASRSVDPIGALANSAAQTAAPTGFEAATAGMQTALNNPSALVNQMGGGMNAAKTFGMAAAPVIADQMVPTTVKAPPMTPGYIRPYQYNENTRQVTAQTPVLASEWGTRSFPQYIPKSPTGLATGGIVAFADGGDTDPYAKYNTLSGQSKAAYDYLMGNASHPVGPAYVPRTVVVPPTNTAPTIPQPPVGQPPVEQPPVITPPQIPIEQPPIEQPPVEQPPVEQPPVEQPPVEQPPVEQPPVEQPPVVQLPIEQNPIFIPTPITQFPGEQTPTTGGTEGTGGTSTTTTTPNPSGIEGTGGTGVITTTPSPSQTEGPGGTGTVTGSGGTSTTPTPSGVETLLPGAGTTTTASTAGGIKDLTGSSGITIPIEQPAPQPVQYPVEQPSPQPVEQPIEQPIEQPSIGDPIDRPMPQPVEQPIEQPVAGLPSLIEQPMPQPVEQPIPQPVEQPMPQPVEQPPVEQPPVEQPPVEQPPVEQPMPQPVGGIPSLIEQPPVETPPTETTPVESPYVEGNPSAQAPVDEVPEVIDHGDGTFSTQNSDGTYNTYDASGNPLGASGEVPQDWQKSATQAGNMGGEEGPVKEGPGIPSATMQSFPTGFEPINEVHYLPTTPEEQAKLDEWFKSQEGQPYLTPAGNLEPAGSLGFNVDTGNDVLDRSNFGDYEGGSMSANTGIGGFGGGFDRYMEAETEAANGGLMGYARGGSARPFYSRETGKFSFQPPRVYAQGGLGTLGGYSDGGRLLKGPGDGVSDSIPASIGSNRQPARLADGEFVVPARIVSELGNGSTEAGARKLYAMMDRIQKARGKTVGKGKVATNSRADKHLPA